MEQPTTEQIHLAMDIMRLFESRRSLNTSYDLQIIAQCKKVLAAAVGVEDEPAA